MKLDWFRAVATIIASIPIGAVQQISAQSADSCDRTLIERNLVSIQQREYTKLISAYYAAENNMSRQSQSLAGSYAGVGVDYGKTEQNVKNSIVQSSIDYTNDRAISTILYYLPESARQTWIECKKLQSNSSVLLLTAGKVGMSAGKPEVVLTITWKPSPDIPGATLKIVRSNIPGMRVPPTISPGDYKGTVVWDDPYSPLLGSITGSPGAMNYSAEVYIPGKTTIKTLYYVGENDIRSCYQRGGHPCWLKSSQAISTDPPDRALSSAEFRIPEGSTFFYADVAPPQCSGADAVLYIDVNGNRRYTSDWPGNKPIKVAIAKDEAGGQMKIGADARGSALCDSIHYLSPRFYRELESSPD